MRAGKVDDDRAGGRLEGGRPFVAETEEEDRGARRGGLVIRDEARQRAVQPHVERRGARAGKRVGAERDELDLRMGEQAVERLLARIAGSPEDGCAWHTVCILRKISHSMQPECDPAAASSSRTAPSSPAPPSARPALRRARRASRPQASATRRRRPTRAMSPRSSASPIPSSATTASIRRDGVGARPGRRRSSCIPPGQTGRPGSRSRASSRSPASTRARSCAASATEGVVRCAVGEAPSRSCAPAPWPSRRSTDGRSTGTSASRNRIVGAGPRVVLVDFGCKRSIVRRLAQTGVEVALVPGDWDADAILELRPSAVLVGNGPGDRRCSPARSRPARPARKRAALRHLPRAPAARPRARAQDLQAAVRHRGANHPVRDTRTGRVLVTVRTRLRRARRRAREPRLAERRHGRGARRRRLREACSSTPRLRPARSTPALLRPDRRDVPKRARPRSILIVAPARFASARAASSTTPRRRRAACSGARVCASCSSTRTPRRS